tara:strand:+ start:2400 stop:2567 length:168 start_codon:yes stop_codon:yes gene_type:complete
MTEDKVIENFSKMFPNCPDPEHQPRVVEYLVKVFKHVEEQRVKKESVDDEGSEDE